MNYWDHHGVLLLICLALFPRLTLLFSSIVSGGFFWWLGWLFTPHFLVALLSIPYWDKNPILVIIAWIFVFLGTGGEAKTGSRISSRR